MFEKASEIRAAQREKIRERGRREGRREARQETSAKAQELLQRPATSKDPETGAITSTRTPAGISFLLGESTDSGE